MRIAVIADIHGNDLALYAVLKDIAAQGISEVVNLGDHLSGPLNAARTADMLMAQDFPSIRGNHDRWLTTRAPVEMNTWDSFSHAELEPRHLDWLRALPPTLLYRDEILLCHGTPSSDTTYWLEDLTPQGVLHMSARQRIEDLAGDQDVAVILCGHTHIPRAVRLADGRLIVNPGSVGCPGYDDDEPVFHKVETGSPDASYAVIEKTGGERTGTAWTVSFRRVRYDNLAMSRLAGERGHGEWQRALSTGWLD
ncbi:metallophosphoesterase family protein [Pararhizobium antarcticum]|uniref:Metallophosphoesterase n=1 Tax=Pararhizobium antarcticum TaxID=1798805 RepID=A0A657LXN0_9HYPH|nr:metallophosphoesterase family protein [Pararhizobium antarcticum]OJF92522.1 metallophosphoesterase [Rhizobium sp. 58]OJG00791.1 metallophosphoesterase [Pararhizobium antarcticum]